MSRERGKVKWYDQEKNYGFIEADNKKEYFVHKSDVEEGSLDKGQAVEFEIGEGKKGPVAKRVRALDSDE
jgi:CspA family cold shock protein